MHDDGFSAASPVDDGAFSVSVLVVVELFHSLLRPIRLHELVHLEDALREEVEEREVEQLVAQWQQEPLQGVQREPQRGVLRWRLEVHNDWETRRLRNLP